MSGNRTSPTWYQLGRLTRRELTRVTGEEPSGWLAWPDAKSSPNAHNASGALKNEAFFRQACHSDDIERIHKERRAGLLQAVPFQLEVRLLKDGKYRWQLIQYNPLKDESGNILRWYATATDIDDQKKTEERLRSENLVLREQIDRDSMSGDIVGSSELLRKVLRQVAKVAPSDSTVLIWVKQAQVRS